MAVGVGRADGRKLIGSCATFSSNGSYGRGAGVGRSRGAGVTLGVGVGGGGVVVGVEVGVNVADGVGDGVPQGISVYCWLSFVGVPGPESPATA